MSNSLRRLKRQQDKDSSLLGPAEQKLPTGRVLTEPLRGAFLSLPWLAWIERRPRDGIPLLKLVLALLQADEGDEGLALKGSLEMEIPLYPYTETAAVATLERYGWTGQTWALGDPPPFDNPALAAQLTGLIEQTTTNLRATLVFAPDPETGSNAAQAIEVLRAKGPFLMPPLEASAEPPKAELVQALANVVRDYGTFFSSTGTALTTEE